MNRLKNIKNELVSFTKFATSSIVTTGLDLAIYSFSIDNLERFFPFFYTFFATIIARIFSDSSKYLLDKYLVFFSDEKFGYIKYMFLATSKTLLSASIVTIIAAIGFEFEEIIKMIVDMILFIPGFIFSKIWVHKK